MIFVVVMLVLHVFMVSHGGEDICIRRSGVLLTLAAFTLYIASAVDCLSCICFEEVLCEWRWVLCLLE